MVRCASLAHHKFFVLSIGKILVAENFAFLVGLSCCGSASLTQRIQVSLPKYLCGKDSGRARPLVRDSPLRGQSLSQAGKDAGVKGILKVSSFGTENYPFFFKKIKALPYAACLLAFSFPTAEVRLL
jgi:hypothetical protein